MILGHGCYKCFLVTNKLLGSRQCLQLGKTLGGGGVWRGGEEGETELKANLQRETVHDE